MARHPQPKTISTQAELSLQPYLLAPEGSLDLFYPLTVVEAVARPQHQHPNLPTQCPF